MEWIVVNRTGADATAGVGAGVGMELHLVFSGTTEVAGLDVGLTPTASSFGKVSPLYGPPGARHSAVVGLGDRERFDAERLRRVAGSAARALLREGYSDGFVDLSRAAGLLGSETCVAAWVEGWTLGAYVFGRYKKEPAPAPLAAMTLAIEGADLERLVRVASLAELRASGTKLARDWTNEPANVMTPGALVEAVERLFADRPGVAVRVYRRGGELERMQMNGLLAVGQGSAHSPALVEIAYSGASSREPLIALIGKGMTFDMGGMNLKTGRDLSEARYDMGGAAAVVGAIDYLSRSEAAANVVALVAVADNVPGSSALLPSSVIRYPNGLTVQVGNTDAEGRLILADALLRAGALGAAEIIDLATLTGSVGHALGLRVAGVWGDAGLAEELRACGEACGERVWPMPLVDDDEDLLRSDYADLSNISSSAYGGAVAAGLFLRRFVPAGVRWAHVDMANVVQAPSARGYETAGATGFGVRLLAEYVASRGAVPPAPSSP